MTFELPEFEKDIEAMVIKHGYGNNYYGHLMINNYPNLQSIIVKSGSFQMSNYLRICNCEQLKSIEIGNRVFTNVRNVNIESIYKQ